MPAPAAKALSRIQAAPLVETASLPAVISALGGFAIFGFCAGLDAWATGMPLRAGPATVTIAAAPFVLTTPALLVVHQLTGMRAAPDRVIAAVSGAIVRTGRLALGLAPVGLFFAATSDLMFPLYIFTGAMLGLTAVVQAAVGVDRAERDAAGRTALSPVLAAGWGFLTGLIGLRIAVEAAAWTFIH